MLSVSKSYCSHNCTRRLQSRKQAASCSRGRVAVFAALTPGAKVKVGRSVVVYHIPGTKGSATDMQGMEGTVVEDVTQYKGKTLSPNLPYKVQFSSNGDNGKAVKFFAHLEESELTEV